MNEISFDKIRTNFLAYLEDTVQQMSIPDDLKGPMAYALEGEGKRLRPVLLLSIIAIAQEGAYERGLATALALEYIHTYSLIHDDLPAMDDDAFRRGRPTNHKVFGEAKAILAGDALLTDAFRLIALDTHLTSQEAQELVSLLSQAAGSQGMVLGQVYDIEAEAQEVSLKHVQSIHQLKTGALFTFAIQAACILAHIEGEEKKRLLDFSRLFGLAFQIHNDLKAATGEQKTIEKKENSDVRLQKATYPSLLGLDATTYLLEETYEQADRLLKELTDLSGRNYQELMVFLDFIRVNNREKEG